MTTTHDPIARTIEIQRAKRQAHSAGMSERYRYIRARCKSLGITKGSTEYELVAADIEREADAAAARVQASREMHVRALESGQPSAQPGGNPTQTAVTPSGYTQAEIDQMVAECEAEGARRDRAKAAAREAAEANKKKEQQAIRILSAIVDARDKQVQRESITAAAIRRAQRRGQKPTQQATGNNNAQDTRIAQLTPKQAYFQAAAIRGTLRKGRSCGFSAEQVAAITAKANQFDLKELCA